MLTAAVAARGTATAFPRYEAAHGYDSFMYAVKPLPKIATLPEVASSTQVQLPTGGNPTCSLFPPHQQQRLQRLRGAAEESAAHGQAGGGQDARRVGPRSGVGVGRPAAKQRGTGRHGDPCPLRGAVAAERRIEQRQPHAVGSDGRPACGGDRSSEIEFPISTAPSDDLYTTQAFARRSTRRRSSCTATSSDSTTARPISPDSSPRPRRRRPGGDRPRQRGQCDRPVDPSPVGRLVDPGRPVGTGRDHRGGPGLEPSDDRGSRHLRHLERPRRSAGGS